LDDGSSGTSEALVLKTTGPLETVADEFAFLESSRFAYSESPALGGGTEPGFDIVIYRTPIVLRIEVQCTSSLTAAERALTRHVSLIRLALQPLEWKKRSLPHRARLDIICPKA
jgi:hypothetical protein